MSLCSTASITPWRSVNAERHFPPEQTPQQLIEAREVIHMQMRDEDIADSQHLTGRKPSKIAKIEQQRPLFENEIDVKTRIVERVVDQRRVEMAWHGSFALIRRAKQKLMRARARSAVRENIVASEKQVTAWACRTSTARRIARNASQPSAPLWMLAPHGGGRVATETRAAKVRAIRDFGADQNAANRQIVRSQLSACYLRLIGKDSAFLISPWKP